MQLLFERGADLNSQNDKGEGILFFFTRREDRDIVK
jgi:hypothetical protein